jgi:Short C-terminal domain
VIEQIRALGRLRDEGLLTDDEFDRKKAYLLDRL